MSRMDILAELFSSGTLVKVMRLFLFNPDDPHDVDDVASITKSTKNSIRSEAKLLTKIDFLKTRTFYKEVVSGKGKNKKTKKKKVKGWILNQKFAYLASLRMLLVNTDIMGDGELKQRLQKTGQIKMIVTSGIFLQDPAGRIDLLVVGDKINAASLGSAIRVIESIVGKELRYAAFSPSEFEYRLSVRDRLIRDVFDFPHLFALNRLTHLDIPGSSDPEVILEG